MAIYKGSNKIADLYYHGVAVAEIYKGNILVWTKAAAEYLVTVSQAANGTITAAPMQGPAGTLVTLSNTPNTGYQLTYYTVNGNQIQGNTFTLNSDSTISGLFTAITYTVTIGTHPNGTLTANPMSGTYGTTVTLSGTPNSGYALDYYTVNGSQISGSTFTLTGNTTVGAVYKASIVPIPMLLLSYLDGQQTSGANTFTASYAKYDTRPNYPKFWTGSYVSANQGKIVNVTSTIADGGLPSGYVGKKCWDLTNGGMMPGNNSTTLNNSAGTGVVPIPSTYSDWTFGMWIKCTSNPTVAPNYTSLAMFTGWGLGTDGSTVMWPQSAAFTAFTFTGYNGMASTGSGSTLHWYKSNLIQLNKWHYFATYYNNSTYTVEFYIDGVKYLSAYASSGSQWADTGGSYGRPTRQLFRAFTGYADTQQPSRYMCEYALSQGKHVDPPTAPIVPA